MAIDGSIDYSGYTRAQIEEALGNVDAARFPRNHARLLEARAAYARDDAAPPELAALQPEFRGDGREYFRIWIVNLALTIATLGIYSAWAKVRKLRYFHGNTFLAGSAFGYHGNPVKILKGRAVAAVLVALYFLAGQVSPIAGLVALAVLIAAIPWLLVKSRLFTMRMTSWRGLRFDFVPDYLGAYRILGGWGLATVATVGLLMPKFLLARYQFIVSRTRFAGASFECEPDTGRFFKTAYIAGVCSLAALFLFAIVFGALAVAGADSGDPEENTLLSLLPLAFYAVIFAPLAGYTNSRNLNEVFRATALRGHRFRSRLGARRLAWLYFTNLVLILLTLGLFTPWAQVRMARYRVETFSVLAAGSLDDLAGVAGRGSAPAAGEEISDLFDVDFGL